MNRLTFSRGVVLGWMLGGGLLLQAGCDHMTPAHAAEGNEEPTVAVQLAAVSHEALARSVRASGTLHLKNEVDLSFKVGGVVTRVGVEAGARVKKGQILATIDPTELNAALSQARQTVEKAERDLARARTLHASSSLAAVDLQNAETGLGVARAVEEAAAFNVRHATIVAPDAGIIDRRMVEVGEVIAPGRPVFHLSGSSRGAVVRVALSDRDALLVRLGDRAQVRLDARPEHGYAAVVSQIASSASPGTGTFEVELRLDERPATAWLSGLTAKVEIAHEEKPSASVPVGALVEGDGDRAFVYVVDAARAKRVPVQLSFLSGERAAIASGLDGVSTVVALGAAELRDGALVRVLP